MKKIAIIFLVSLYGILSIGVHAHLHYCCGKLTDVHLIGACNGEPCKGCEGNQYGKLCCSIESLDFVIEQEHKSSNFQLLFFNTEKHLDASSLFSASILPGATDFVSDSGPPLRQRLYLKYSSLIYYA